MPRPTAALLLGLSLLAGGTLPFAQSQQGGLRLLSRQAARTLPTVSVNNQEYVALDELATAFNVTFREDQLAGGVTVTAGSRTIIITADQPVVSVSGRLVSLQQPPIKQGNRWLVPLDFLSTALSQALGTRIEVRRASRAVLLGDYRMPRVAARVESGPGSTVVTFDVTPPAAARVVVEPGRLVATFEADVIELALPSVAPSDFLQSLQAEGPTAVRLATGPKFGVHRATTSQPDANSSRLVIELLPATTEAAPAVPPAAPTTPTAPNAPTAPAPSSPAPDIPLQLPPATATVRTIAIDAGHGGDEPGVTGAGGILEKDVALSIARRLRTSIESKLGLRVFMTREDDRKMTLDERSAYANSQKADVFVSIHANAAPRPTIKGAEVHYLSLYTPPNADPQTTPTEVVLPTIGGGARAIALTPWDTAQSRYLDQSALLANLTEQALRAKVEMSPRAVQQGPFRVLVGANMAAVVVEVGYLSNPEQEKALASGSYQDRIATALLEAVSAYRAAVERTGTPAAPAAPGPGAPSAPGAPRAPAPRSVP